MLTEYYWKKISFIKLPAVPTIYIQIVFTWSLLRELNCFRLYMQNNNYINDNIEPTEFSFNRGCK